MRAAGVGLGLVGLDRSLVGLVRVGFGWAWLLWAVPWLYLSALWGPGVRLGWVVRRSVGLVWPGGLALNLRFRPEAPAAQARHSDLNCLSDPN